MAAKKRSSSKARQSRARTPPPESWRSYLLDVAVLLLVDLELRFRVENALLLKKWAKSAEPESVRRRPFRVVEAIESMLRLRLGEMQDDTRLKSDEALAELPEKELHAMARQFEARLAEQWGRGIFTRDSKIPEMVRKRARLARALIFDRLIEDQAEISRALGRPFRKEHAQADHAELLGKSGDSRSFRAVLGEAPTARGGWYGEVDRRLYESPMPARARGGRARKN